MSLSEIIDVKVLLLGESGVGKTTLITKYVTKEFPKYAPSTVVVDYLQKEVVVDDTHVNMRIWDTAGQERFHALNAIAYRGSHCCVLVYDTTVETTFKTIAFWRDQFLAKAFSIDDETFPFVVIGNKIDKEDREVPYDEANGWCQRTNNIPFYECSANINYNIDRAFQNVARLALQEKIRVMQQENEWNESTRSKLALQDEKHVGQHLTPQKRFWNKLNKINLHTKEKKLKMSAKWC